MVFGLARQDNGFFDLYAASAGHVMAGARQLTELFGAPLSERPTVVAGMHEIEGLGDETTHEIVRRVDGSFVTPFDRRDMHSLALLLDDCLDHMDAAVDIIDVYRIEALPTESTTQVEILCRMAELTVSAMPRLRAAKRLAEYWIEINRLENQADRAARRAMAELFDGPHKAQSILKQQAVVTELENAANAFERVAHLIEGLALQES